MIGNMIETDHFTIECGTCLAAGTTACTDCVVAHLIANDDGPVNFLTVRPGPPESQLNRAIALFERAGLLDDPVEFVSIEVFESFSADNPVLAPSSR